jgi:acetyl-CoA C-acetyltransferase
MRGRETVIVAAARTPIGKFQGALKTLTAPQLGALAVRAVLERSGISPARVDEVLMGCVLQAGLGQNPARQAALEAGLPPSVSAMTVNMVCGSGLKSVMLASQAIQLGDHEVVLAGGMESMSNAPYLLPRAIDWATGPSSTRCCGMGSGARGTIGIWERRPKWWRSGMG